MNKSILMFAVCISLMNEACSQNKNQIINSEPIIQSQKINMDISQINNLIVKSAIEALQANDINSWYSYFTEDAVFTDDGNKMDFKRFFDNAFNHKEKFLTIDKIDNEGKKITGDFFAGQWGTFKVFFKFHINSEGKINQLDIGQVK